MSDNHNESTNNTNQKVHSSEPNKLPYHDNDDDDDDTIQEEQPQLRHVKITSGRPSPLKNLPLLPPGKLPGPPKGHLMRPPKISSHKTSTSSPLAVTKEWTAKVASWKVALTDIERLPDFPLERTNREIHGSDVSIVATRISSALQKLSIQADYNKDHAKCHTSDFVSFCVRLYSGGDNGQPVVVELQRQKGSGFNFMQSCRAILNAAEGMDLSVAAINGSTTQRKMKMPPFNGKPISQMKCLKSLSLTSSSTTTTAANEAHKAVQSCIELLRHDKIDSNILGMENLVCLTDPIKSSPLTATQVAKTVITGSTLDNIRDEIYATIAKTIDTEHVRAEHATILRRHALHVFDNSLKLFSVDESVWNNQSWLHGAFIKMLLEEIRNVESSSSSSSSYCPHNAYIAMSCLYSLVSGCPTARHRIMEHKGYRGAIEQASKIGQERHELLANESQRCLQLLDRP
mmetsp:Transcript_2054/g.2817  ORF Transcript_2054/g.2817 Transcript_2054/m.2817 type:complete len:459 (+) Transcript_2054:732-2108(+)